MVNIRVYLNDGNTVEYTVTDIYKAVEHAFRIVSGGWRNQDVSGKWMEYYVVTEVLKVVIDVPEEQKWTDSITPQVTVDLKDGTPLTFDLFFEKSLRELAYNAPLRGFGYLTKDEKHIEFRPAYQVRKIYWDINDDNKDLMMIKYEAK